ncbi:MAG: LysR family transcriptional regulator, partial [Xanthobacteraceae bacterium]
MRPHAVFWAALTWTKAGWRRLALSQNRSSGRGSQEDGIIVPSIPFQYRSQAAGYQFRDVVAIAERGSLRAAARYLPLAQPALTRSVQELERELGAPLFERRAPGMVLTP